MPPVDTTDKEDNTVDELLQVINVLVTEVQPNRPAKAITLDTSFEKDLGLGVQCLFQVTTGLSRSSIEFFRH